MVLLDEDNRLSAKPGLQELLWGVGQEQLRAANEIRRLTKNSARARAYLGGAGVIVPLTSMLRSSSKEAKEAAVLALLNLAVGNERNKIRIVEAGVVDPLVELLRSDDSTLKENATAVVLTLSAASANKQAIGMSGVTSLLVELLSSGSMQAKVDSLLALYNLSSCPDILVQILDAGGVAPLLHVLKGCRKSSKVAEKIMAILESLMRFEEGRSCAIKESGGLLAMVEVLEEGTLSGREYALGALLTMCESDRCRYGGAILEEGVIPGLLELSVQGTPQAQCKARTLLDLLRDTPAHRRAASASRPPAAMIENIVSEISSHVDSGEPSAMGAAKKMLMDALHLSMDPDIGSLMAGRLA